MPECALTTAARHVAIIMDGNGRWATEQGRSRVFGHARGADVAIDITREAYRLGIKTLTLFALSTENMNRPAYEVAFITKLLMDVLEREAEDLIQKKIVVRVVGAISELDKRLHALIARIKTQIGSEVVMELNIAFNFSGRWHLQYALGQCMAHMHARKENEEQEFDATRVFQNALYADIVSDPDLVIRTGGEMRISNFMLWHMAYSELYFESCYWPAYTSGALLNALNAYALRVRKFGQIANESSTVQVENR